MEFGTGGGRRDSSSCAVFKACAELFWHSATLVGSVVDDLGLRVGLSETCTGQLFVGGSNDHIGAPHCPIIC